MNRNKDQQRLESLYEQAMKSLRPRRHEWEQPAGEIKEPEDAIHIFDWIRDGVSNISDEIEVANAIEEVIWDQGLDEQAILGELKYIRDLAREGEEEFINIFGDEYIWITELIDLDVLYDQLTEYSSEAEQDDYERTNF